MTREEFVKNIAETFEKGLAIIKVKNDDYAKGEDPFKNFKFSEMAGIDVPHAILVRTLDKMARISNLLDKGGKHSVKDETVEDTILDSINYLAILKAYLTDTK